MKYRTFMSPRDIFYGQGAIESLTRLPIVAYQAVGRLWPALMFRIPLEVRQDDTVVLEGAW